MNKALTITLTVLGIMLLLPLFAAAVLFVAIFIVG